MARFLLRMRRFPSRRTWLIKQSWFLQSTKGKPFGDVNATSRLEIGLETCTIEQNSAVSDRCTHCWICFILPRQLYGDVGMCAVAFAIDVDLHIDECPK